MELQNERFRGKILILDISFPSGWFATQSGFQELLTARFKELEERKWAIGLTREQLPKKKFSLNSFLLNTNYCIIADSSAE